MTQESKILTGIDVGTTKVATIIGRKSKTWGIEVLGYGIVPCDGLSKGNVADVAATKKAIKASVEEAEKMAKVKVTEAYVGVTGSHVSFENRYDTLDDIGKMGVITVEDMERVPEKVAASGEIPGRKVIHALPVNYALDGGYSVRNPIGMHTRRMEVETHVVTGAESFINRLVEAVEGNGIEVKDFVLEPLASSEAVLTQREKDYGAALVDIGGGTTDVVAFNEGCVNYTGVIPIGGFQFTNDIVLTYNTSYEYAENIKLNHATTQTDRVRHDEELTLRMAGRSAELRVPKHEICQLMRERARELVRLINVKLKDANINGSEGTIVLTGGASNLPGLQEMLREYMNQEVRIGMPNGQWNLPDPLRAPSYSTGVGILLWAIKNQNYNDDQKGVISIQGINVTNGVNGHNGNNGPVVEPREKGVVSRFMRQLKSIF